MCSGETCTTCARERLVPRVLGRDLYHMCSGETCTTCARERLVPRVLGRDLYHVCSGETSTTCARERLVPRVLGRELYHVCSGETGNTLASQLVSLVEHTTLPRPSFWPQLSDSDMLGLVLKVTVHGDVHTHRSVRRLTFKNI